MNRGNNRRTIFCDEVDCEWFLTILNRAAAQYHVSAHGYVLMTNHFHLLATPETPEALSRMMKVVGGRYVRYYNRKYDRIGTLWSGRYRAIPIHDERYLLTCLRYIEQNPVRASMVSEPGAYRWSSYAIHATGVPSEWIVPHRVYVTLGICAEERQAAYRAICGTALPEDTLRRFRHIDLVSEASAAAKGLTPGSDRRVRSALPVAGGATDGV